MFFQDLPLHETWSKQAWGGAVLVIRIQSGQKLPDGGDLEEPVEARLLGCVIHVINCERVCGGEIKYVITHNVDNDKTNKQTNKIKHWMREI